jgi:hypothetical protein
MNESDESRNELDGQIATAKIEYDKARKRLWKLKQRREKMRGVWQPADCVEWTYARPEGDLVVFARDATEAAMTIMGHGFRIVDPKKLKQTSTRLTDVLKKEEIR